MLHKPLVYVLYKLTAPSEIIVSLRHVGAIQKVVSNMSAGYYRIAERREATVDSLH